MSRSIRNRRQPANKQTRRPGRTEVLGLPQVKRLIFTLCAQRGRTPVACLPEEWKASGRRWPDRPALSWPEGLGGAPNYSGTFLPAERLGTSTSRSDLCPDTRGSRHPHHRKDLRMGMARPVHQPLVSSGKVSSSARSRASVSWDIAAMACRLFAMARCSRPARACSISCTRAWRINS